MKKGIQKGHYTVFTGLIHMELKESVSSTIYAIMQIFVVLFYPKSLLQDSFWTKVASEI